MKTPNLKTKKNKSSSTCVRFTEEQYNKILELSVESGESIPSLLKKSFFNRQFKTPIISNQEAQKIISAINRIGNNVNQIARKMNSGHYEGWYTEFQKAIDAYTAIAKHVSDFGRGKR